MHSRCSLDPSIAGAAGRDVAAINGLWRGPDAQQFANAWRSIHYPRLMTATTALGTAAETVRRNRTQQEATSAATSGTGGSAVGNATDFLLGDVAALWNGGADGFPTGSLTAGLLRVGRTGFWMLNPADPLRFPTFNTGLVGRGAAAGMQRIPGLGGVANWMGTPGATNAFRAVGIAGGVIGTGAGLYNLYQQGNPIDAFNADRAGYVADVAGTAFSASTTAFLIAPNPVTGALVIGTGVVWAGAEIVDHWDDISDFGSDVWDAGGGVVDDLGSAAGDVLGGAWNAVDSWF